MVVALMRSRSWPSWPFHFAVVSFREGKWSGRQDLNPRPLAWTVRLRAGFPPAFYQAELLPPSRVCWTLDQRTRFFAATMVRLPQMFLEALHRRGKQATNDPCHLWLTLEVLHLAWR